MRPIGLYKCPENFRESLTMPTVTFPEISNGVFFRLMLWICVQNSKFVALPVPEIIWEYPKIGAVPAYAHAPFLVKFLTSLCSDGPHECSGQIWSPYSATRSWDNSDWRFWFLVAAENPILGEEEAIVDRRLPLQLLNVFVLCLKLVLDGVRMIPISSSWLLELDRVKCFLPIFSLSLSTTSWTRQLSYRKEDRAMRTIYACPEKFWESSLRTRLLLQKFVMDFCSDRY